MEIAPSTIRIGQTTAAEPRPAASAGTQAIATDLAPVQAVAKVAPEPQVQQDLAGSRPDAVDRRFEIDGATHEVISRVYDKATGDLLSQVPDMALLRLKAYAREEVARLDAEAQNRRVQRIV